MQPYMNMHLYKKNYLSKLSQADFLQFIFISHLYVNYEKKKS